MRVRCPSVPQNESHPAGALNRNALLQNLWSRPVVWLLALLLLSTAASPAARPPLETQIPYGSLPVYFEANRGQADVRFAFIARGQHHGVYLASAEAVVALARADGSETRLFRMNLVGANTRAAAAGQEPLPSTVNYFLGNDPSRWQTAVPTFGEVRFTSVYPGIDLVYHRSERQLEYDFIIAPGVDPRAIALRFDGPERIRVGAVGELILEAGEARVFQHRPVVHQTIAGVRREIAGRYELKDAHTAAFALGAYDTNHPLVIDPILSFATYLGGKQADKGWAIAVDGNGAAFIAGETLSVFKSVPASGFQTNFAGGNQNGGDAFVAKLNPAGTAFEFLTYLGGKGLDGAVAVAVDPSGNAYVAGYTVSGDFPITPGVLQPVLAGETVDRTPYKPADAFVSKISPTGSTLLYSTYLGGSSYDSALAIAVDAAGSALVTGYTETAASFRLTNRVCTTRCTNSICGATVCKTNAQTANAFELESTVTNIIRVTVTDGEPPVTNTVEEIVTTTLLSGRTLDPGFPVTNAAQPFFSGGTDAFVTKLNPDATALVYSTHLGGADDENGTGIAIDPAGNAYVTGWTASTDFPVSTNAFQIVRGADRDAFVTSFDPNGTFRYSTYLGGSSDDVGYRIAVDGSGSAYVTGAKRSTDFPSTPGAFNRGGVFKSADAAASWTSSGLGLTHTAVEALARTPAGELLAATPRGVFRSADGGANWSVSFGTLSLNGVHSLASDATATNLYAGTGKGLLLSTNGGATWFFESGGLGNRFVSALAHNGDTIFAGTRGSGIFRSTNNASSWRTSNNGLGNLYLNAFALHPMDASILYAATDGGVFRSTNGGANWRAANNGLTTKKTLAIVIDPAAPTTLYAGTTKGVFKSVNAGSNWIASSTGLGNSNVAALAITATTTATAPKGVNGLPQTPVPGTLYAGTTNGLFKSIDSGATWTANSTGLVPRFVKALLLDPANPAALYAGLRASNFFGGSNDVFLTKLLPDGSGLAYSLAFGGKKNDQGWGVAVDAMGRAFVAGSTDSTNFPVAGPTTSQQATNTGKNDAFLTQFDPDGAFMIYSIYLGGRGNDYAYAVAIDGAGTAFLTGRTDSSTFPVVSPIQPGIAGSPDVFIAKVISAVALRVARGPLPGFALEGAENMTGPWTSLPQPPQFKNGWNSVMLPSATPARFFRLKSVSP
jgi:hypothetical protein